MSGGACGVSICGPARRPTRRRNCISSLTTQLTLTWCTCSSSVATRRRCSGTRPRSSPTTCPGGSAAGRAASGGDGNASVGERRADISSGLTPGRGAAGQAGLSDDGMDVVLHGRQRDGQGPGDLLVRQAFGYQGGDLAFAGGQRGEQGRDARGAGPMTVITAPPPPGWPARSVTGRASAESPHTRR